MAPPARRIPPRPQPGLDCGSTLQRYVRAGPRQYHCPDQSPNGERPVQWYCYWLYRRRPKPGLQPVRRTLCRWAGGRSQSGLHTSRYADLGGDAKRLHLHHDEAGVLPVLRVAVATPSSSVTTVTDVVPRLASVPG